MIKNQKLQSNIICIMEEKRLMSILYLMLSIFVYRLVFVHTYVCAPPWLPVVTAFLVCFTSLAQQFVIL